MEMKGCLGSCQPVQILNINIAINGISQLDVYDDCGNIYAPELLEYAYSPDMVCWSCYMSWSDLVKLTSDLETDFFIRVKIQGVIGTVYINDEQTFDYCTSLDTEFNFSDCQDNPSVWQPYNNMECAITLQQQLAETVACMFGIPIYYFKLAGNAGGRDLTFKEYTLLDVDSVKQIKLIVQDGLMPSSKPTFSELGFDWDTDWQTEVTKGMFATAFGINAQPTEGDLIYIPMMKRMWMVNEAYEEKREGLMWVAPTFKLMLVKYEEKGSVNLGNTEELVNSLVRNKYDDLFGDDENIACGTQSIEAPKHASESLYPVYESDSTRKYVTCFNNEIKGESLYHRGTLVSDYCYDFTKGADDTMVMYQHKYCGENGTVSVIITPQSGEYKGSLIEIGTTTVTIEQTKENTGIYLASNDKLSLTLDNNTTYLVVLRWSRMLNLLELSAYKYTHPENIPLYKLQSHMYYFDIDHPIKKVDRWNIELAQEKKKDVCIGKILGYITNFKLFDTYETNMTLLLMQYPTNGHLIINDTARKLIDGTGISQI